MKIFIVAFSLILGLLFMQNSLACSSYKVTIGDKTMVGSNFDAYYLNCQVWFENAKSANEYGAAFTGGRVDGEDGIAPQTGMNELGLTFSRLSSAPLEKELLPNSHKKTITNPTLYLKDILHKCKNIEEVKNYISQYDQGFFIEDVFIYVDKTGKYLVVEPDTMVIANELKYVLANFCPSQITDFKSVKQDKYQKGVVFLQNKIDTTIAFCTALSDTMHVCRAKVGDGTLLTIIRDLKLGDFYLNFYHDYKHQVKFNLKEELAKGDHDYIIPKLFPPNAEYQRLINYKTPKNSNVVAIFMLSSGAFCFISMIFFGISFFFTRKKIVYPNIQLILSFFSAFLLYYLFELMTNQLIFYFPAPYQDTKFSLLNIASYIPPLMLLSFIPSVVVNVRVFKENLWSFWAKSFFALNNLMYFCLIMLFAYWGLLNIF